METSRARLRRFRPSDLPGLRRLHVDADIMKFTSLRIPQTLAQTEKRLAQLVEQHPDDYALGVWAAELKDGERFFGLFMLIDTTDPAELGYMIDKEFWGHGLATEVCAEIVRFAFSTRKLTKMMARTNVDNAASIRVLEKLGFELLEVVASTDATFGSIPLNYYELAKP